MLGIVLRGARHRKRPLFGVWAALIGVLMVVGFAHGTFVFGSIWLNVTFPVLFIVVDYLVITSYKYFTDMLKTAEELKLGGERKHLTALFSDLNLTRYFPSYFPNTKFPGTLISIERINIDKTDDILKQYLYAVGD